MAEPTRELTDKEKAFKARIEGAIVPDEELKPTRALTEKEKGFTERLGADKGIADSASSNLSLAQPLSPDSEVKAYEYSRDNDTTINLAREAEKIPETQRVFPSQAASKSPSIRKYFGKDLNNAAISKDDSEGLLEIERSINHEPTNIVSIDGDTDIFMGDPQAIPEGGLEPVEPAELPLPPAQREVRAMSVSEKGARAFQVGLHNLTLADMRWNQIWNDIPESEGAIQQFKAQMPRPVEGENIIEDFVNATTGFLPLVIDSFLKAQEHGLAGAVGAGGAAALAGQVGPQILAPEEIITVPTAAGIGYSAGTIYGAGQNIYKKEAGLFFDEILGLEDENGDPIDRNVLKVAALAYASASTFFEMVGLKYISKNFPGAERLLGRFTKVPVKKILQTSPTLRKTFLKIAKTWLVGGTAEGATEGIQQATSILTTELAKYYAKNKDGAYFLPFDWGNAFKRIGQDTYHGTLGGLGLGSGGTVISTVKTVHDVNVSKKFQAKIEATKESLEAAITKQRSADHAERYLNETPIEKEAYVPPEGSEALFKIDKPEAETLLRKLGISPREARRKAALGQDVIVDMPKVLSQLTEEEYTSIKQYLKPKPDSYTGKQLKEKAAVDETEHIKEIYSEVTADETDFQEELTRIRDDIIKTGATEEVADTNLSLVERFANGLALQGQDRTAFLNRIKSIKKKRLERKDKAAARAKGVLDIFEDNSFAITVFEGAEDLATLPHELGHIFFIEMQKAEGLKGISDQFKADMNALRKWVGVKEGQAMTEAHNEQFAAGWEQWLREGKAPNSSLAVVFERFKTWLKGIYKSQRSLGVKLNKDVREVFNRMLDAEEEVKTVAAINNMVAPTAARMDELNIPKDNQFNIKRLVFKATNKAENNLFNDRNRAVKSNKKRFTSEAEVEARRADTQGIYKIIQTIKDVDLYNKVTGLTDEPRLNRQEFINRYGKDAIANLPDRQILVNNGKALDDAALIYDFENGDEMMQAFFDTPPLQDAIDFRVQLKVEALENTFSPDSYLSSTQEYREYLSIMDKALRDNIEVSEIAEARGSVSKKRISRERFKALAQSIMEERNVSDAQRTDIPLAAMKRASIAQIKAERKGDYAKAIRENEKALLNNELVAIAGRNRKEVNKVLKRAAKFRKIGKPESVALEHREAIRSLINRFQLIPGVAPQKPVTDEALRKLLLNNNQDGFNPSVFLTEVREDYRKRSMLDFIEIDNAIKYLNTKGRDQELGLLTDGVTKLQDVGRGSMAEMDAQKKQKVFDQFNPWKKMSDVARKAYSRITNVSFVTAALGGYTSLKGKTSFLETYVTERLKDMTDAHSRRRRSVFKDIEKHTDHIVDAQIRIARKHGRKLFVKDHGVPVPELLKKNGAQLNYFTGEDVLAMAFNRGNDSNTDALIKGFDGLTLPQVDSLLNRYLTIKDIEAVQAIIDGMESLFAEMDRVHVNLKGYHIKKVQARPWTFKGRTFKGGYYPLMIDRWLASVNSDVFNSLKEAEEYFEKTEAQYTVPFATANFTITRKDGHALPISLKLNNIFRHFDKVIRYITMAEGARDITRIVTYSEKTPEGTRSFKRSAVRVMGEEMYKQILPAVQHTVNPQLDGVDTPGQKYIGWLRGIAVSRNLAAKLFTGLKQPFSLFGGVHDLGVKRGKGIAAGMTSLIKGAGHVLASPSASFTTMLDKSSFMRDRITSFERDFLRPQFNKMTPSTKEIIFGSRGFTWDDVIKATFITVSAPDIATVTPIWWGGYLDKINEGATEKQAVRHADNIIRHSQPTAAPIDRSAWFRKNGFWGLFNLHQTFTVNTYGQRQRAWFGAWKSGKVSLIDYGRFNMMDGIIPMVLMQTMITWLKSGDLGDEEEWYDIMIKAAQGWMLTGIPMANSFFDALWNGRRGGILEIPGAGQVDRWVQTGHLITGGIDGMTEEEKERAYWGVFDFASDVSRVPVSRIVRQAVKGKTTKEKLFGPKKRPAGDKGRSRQRR